MPEPAILYPWYRVVHGGELEQGDILRAFEVAVPAVIFEPGIDEYDVILQSVDAVIMPYKEHLAQAFARFFMRVGLPVNIPKERLKQTN